MFRRSTKLIAVLSVLLVLSQGATADIWKYLFSPRLSHAPRVANSAVYKVTAGLDALNGTIGCFGDFNNDR